MTKIVSFFHLENVPIFTSTERRNSRPLRSVDRSQNLLQNTHEKCAQLSCLDQIESNSEAILIDKSFVSYFDVISYMLE